MRSSQLTHLASVQRSVASLSALVLVGNRNAHLLMEILQPTKVFGMVTCTPPQRSAAVCDNLTCTDFIWRGISDS